MKAKISEDMAVLFDVRAVEEDVGNCVPHGTVWA